MFSLNSKTLNTITLNGAATTSTILGTGVGTLVSFVQSVQTTASGALVSFIQEVVFSETGEGTLVSFEQSVAATASGTLVEFVQIVASPSISTFLSRNGWYPSVVIAGARIPDSMIRNFKIEKNEDDASQLDIQLLLSPGNIDLDYYVGKPIYIDIIKNDGTSYRPFTGFINLPSIDILNRYLNLSCNDFRRELINQRYVDYVKLLGYYSTAIFGDGTGDIASELETRLTTVPFSVNVNGYGSLVLSSIFAKASADYSYSDGDVLRENNRDPVYTKALRSRIVNTVNITFTYQYQRAYHRTRGFSWSANYGNTCEFLTNGYDVARREMIAAAVESAGWPIMNSISYNPILASGFYKCFGFNVGWSTVTTSGSTVQQTDALGNLVTSASGDPIYDYAITSVVDIAPTLCDGAGWLATTRFVQNISEVYSLSVTAPQSTNQYGVVEQSESASFTSEFNSAAWETYTSFQQPPAGFVTNGSATNYYINMDTNLSGYYEAMYTILNKARTTILRGHRADYVDFQLKKVAPQLEISNTVALSTDIITTRGKVHALTHTCDVTTGEATTKVRLAISRVTGSSSDSFLPIPPRPTYEPEQEGAGIRLSSHYGLEPNPQWTGFIGNKWLTENTGGGTTNRFKTSFPISFTVDTPEIEDAVRANVALPTSLSYDIAIPNDPLTITVI